MTASASSDPLRAPRPRVTTTTTTLLPLALLYLVVLSSAAMTTALTLPSQKQHHRADDAVGGGPLTPAQIAEFDETGVVVVRGLVTGELLARARSEQTALGNDLPGKEYDAVAFSAWRRSPVFRELALSSPVARAAAQLLGRDDLRMLLDAFFEYKGDLPGCGWHVDDAFFWPVKRTDVDGVNVWLALDDVDDDGGGLAVAPGTDAADFDDARRVIHGRGPDGKAQTCHMEHLDAAQNARIEARAVIPTMRAGDAILHKRFVFHRSQPIQTADAARSGARRSIGRYSCRYVPPDVTLEGITLVTGNDGGRPSVVPLPNVRIDEAHARHFPDKFPRIQLDDGGFPSNPDETSYPTAAVS